MLILQSNVDPSYALSYGDFLLMMSTLSLFYVIMINYFNKLTGNPRGDVQFKNELKAILMNAVLFVTIVFAWKALDAISGEGRIYKLGGNAIINLIETSKKAYKMNANLISYFAVVSSIQAKASFAVWSFQVGGGLGFDGYSLVLEKLVGFNSNIFSHILALNTLREMLMHFDFFSILFFLPVGILFRTFPLTRRLGSTMVAISLGAGIMLPVSVFFAGDIVLSMLNDPLILGYTSKINEAASHLSDFTKFKITTYTLYIIVSVLDQSARALTIISNASDLLAFIPIIGQIAQSVYSIIDGVTKIVLFGIGVSLTGTLTFLLSDVVFDSDYFISMAEAVISLNVGLIIFYFTVTFSTLSAIRVFSIALGGEFFLYGVSGLL